MWQILADVNNGAIVRGKHSYVELGRQLRCPIPLRQQARPFRMLLSKHTCRKAGRRAHDCTGGAWPSRGDLVGPDSVNYIGLSLGQGIERFGQFGKPPLAGLFQTRLILLKPALFI